MAPPKRNHKKESNSVLIDADFRIKIEKAIENFAFASNDMCYEFPSSLTNVERAFVHNMAPKYNLKTKSSGLDENRKLSLYKLTENEDFSNKSVKMNMNKESLSILRHFQNDFPEKEKRNPNIRQEAQKSNSKPMVLSKPPNVPPPSRADSRIQEKRTTLPIFSFRQKILESIDENRIILIHGSTGSGKTTQIPQYILENAHEKNLPCRILCTQPRRISTIASADRVCYERMESTGGTIGYQIRLESSFSQDTNCIFLTPGVFLRYLMNGNPEALFNNITHILVDEAHERAKENDFLLTSIKEHFNANPDLKLIIMSATMDTGVFAGYFGTCEEISISTKQYHVEEIYLEDILKMMQFRNSDVDKLNERFMRGELVEASNSAYVNEAAESEMPLNLETQTYLNDILENMSTSENPDSAFDQFVYLVQAEDIPVNFRHTETKMTALMVAVGRGSVASVETLLKLKAETGFKVSLNGIEFTCLDLANQMFGPDSEMVKLLQFYADLNKTKVLSSTDVYNKALLNIYYDSILTTKNNNFIVEEGVDHDLVMSLIEKIHFEAAREGAILVFLPGYDDITQLSNMVKDRLRNYDYELFLLHSSMKTEDQKNVFKQVIQGKRKIILSTNIAESSITIDDVVYVIDSGREKQKSYDAISHSSALRVQWISKASANQRKGRAGRLLNGYVYRIYSQERYTSMLETAIPELLRNSLTEICLQTKMMIGESLKIEEFLMKCIATPSVASIRQSIKLLQCLGALDENEKLTLMGSHLAHMPVDAKYAKMLVYGIALRCLSPVLSIVSILSVGDQIFVLPAKPADRFKCHTLRRTLAENSMSDHFVMLKIFNKWMHQKKNRTNDRRFCEENFISNNAMEHVRGIRGQIHNYLQSSGLFKVQLNLLDENAHKWPVVKACLCAGLYPNVARIDGPKRSMFSDIDHRLVFHMSSVMFNKGDKSNDSLRDMPSDWVVFEEKNRIGRFPMIRCNTLVNSFSLSLSAGASLSSEAVERIEGDWEDNDEILFKIDNLVTLLARKDDGLLMLNLRQKLDSMIERFLGLPNFKYLEIDEALIEALVQVLEIEEKNSGFDKMSLELKYEPPMSSNNGSGSRYGPSQSNGSFYDNNSGNSWRNQSNGNQSNGNQPNGNQWSRRDQNNFNGNTSDRMKAPWPATQDKFYGSSGQKSSAPNRGREFHNQSSNGFQRQPLQNPDLPSRSSTFFNNQPGSLTKNLSGSSQPASAKVSKYFVMKMNSDDILTTCATKIHFDIEMLKLKGWFLDKLANMIHPQIFIIFYSTIRFEFVGFGEIMRRTNKDQPIKFHFKLLKTLPHERVQRNLPPNALQLFKNRSAQVEELSKETGGVVLSLFES